jgi:hypothetical protein
VDRALRLVSWSRRGVVAVLVLGVLAAVGIVLLAGWFGRESESQYAKKAIQSAFTLSRVDACHEIGSDSEARIFRCRIVARSCVRSFRFAVMRDHMYGIAPYSVSADAYDRPCRFRSD